MHEGANSEFLTKRELVDRLLEEGDAPPVTKLSTRRIIFPAASAREWLAGRTTSHLEDDAD